MSDVIPNFLNMRSDRSIGLGCDDRGRRALLHFTLGMAAVDGSHP
jgi:hypothetical protein